MAKNDLGSTVIDLLTWIDANTTGAARVRGRWLVNALLAECESETKALLAAAAAPVHVPPVEKCGTCGAVWSIDCPACAKKV